jgi:hypothetical protein
VGRPRAWLFNPRPGGILVDVAAGKPWWLMTKTVRKGYVGSVFCVALGLYWLVAGLTLSAFWMLLLAAWFLVGALLYLTSALTLRRRERSRRSGPV